MSDIIGSVWYIGISILFFRYYAEWMKRMPRNTDSIYLSSYSIYFFCEAVLLLALMSFANDALDTIENYWQKQLDEIWTREEIEGE